MSKLTILFDRLASLGWAMEKAEKETAANGEAYQGLTPKTAASAKATEVTQLGHHTSRAGRKQNLSTHFEKNGGDV